MEIFKLLSKNVKLYKANEWLDLSKFSSKYQVNSVDIPTKGVRTTVTINNIDQDDFGNYTIIATNQYGEAKIYTQLESKSKNFQRFENL